MEGSLRGNKGPRIRPVADDSAPYETITVDKLTPIIGAELGGIDLAQPLSNRQQDEIHRSMTASRSIAASTRIPTWPRRSSIRGPSIRWCAPIR
jgi:hypothetical protein